MHVSKLGKDTHYFVVKEFHEDPQICQGDSSTGSSDPNLLLLYSRVSPGDFTAPARGFWGCAGPQQEPPCSSFCTNFTKTQLRKGVWQFMCQTDGWEERYLER